MFITLEGPDGSGKTTQLGLLADRLKALRYNVITTREPGGTPLGALIRTLLLDSDHAVSSVTEAYLMTADRSEHMRQVVWPALERGDVVISDRYLDSTLAYQGGGRGLDMAQLRSLQDMATDGLLPDLTLLLEIPVEDGLRRKFDDEAGNRMDRESLQFHQRVAETYRELACAEPDRWQVVDATQAVEMVHTAIWFHVAERLEVRRAALVGGQDL